MSVSPPGSTKPADGFSTVPLVDGDTPENGGQEGALVCTCRASEDDDEFEDEAEEEGAEDGVGCAAVLPGRLAVVNAGLMVSCTETGRGRAK